jgi:hypothetical protein
MKAVFEQMLVDVLGKDGSRRMASNERQLLVNWRRAIVQFSVAHFFPINDLCKSCE